MRRGIVQSRNHLGMRPAAPNSAADRSAN
jgi:hypothetical protein